MTDSLFLQFLRLAPPELLERTTQIASKSASGEIEDVFGWCEAALLRLHLDVVEFSGSSVTFPNIAMPFSSKVDEKFRYFVHVLLSECIEALQQGVLEASGIGSKKRIVRKIDRGMWHQGCRVDFRNSTVWFNGADVQFNNVSLRLIQKDELSKVRKPDESTYLFFWNAADLPQPHLTKPSVIEAPGPGARFTTSEIDKEYRRRCREAGRLLEPTAALIADLFNWGLERGLVRNNPKTGKPKPARDTIYRNVQAIFRAGILSDI